MIHSTVKIGEYCIICDNVTIGKDTVIMNGVEIRSNTVIGSNCYIDSGVKISGECVVGDNVTLRYNTIIARGCEIGSNTYFAPNCMTNNLDTNGGKIGGAKVGEGCFFGTNTVLHHGINIADGTITGVNSFLNKSTYDKCQTFVGSPAKQITK